MVATNQYDTKVITGLCTTYVRMWLFCSYTATYSMYLCCMSKFGKSFVVLQTKTIQSVDKVNNLLADLFICQKFFCQMLEKSKLAKANFTCYINREGCLSTKVS